MKNYPIFFIPLFILLSAFKAYGQKTGSFDESISFNSENRTLACYVPTNYNADSSYRLIIALHGLGDSASNYRNALINSLDWQNIFTNTIFVCPDGGYDQNSDFHAPAGDEQIIQKAIDFAKANYSIDKADILLQGFSLGGRSALKYGLDHVSSFNGLLLNTPALQGIADVLNDPNLGFGIDYAKASQIPIYICYGDEDALYVSVIELTIDKLIEHDAQLNYEKVQGLGHSMASKTYISKSVPFFEEPITAGLDLELRNIQLPSLTCDTKLFPAVLLRNIGSTNITQIEIGYEVSGTQKTYTWNGILTSFSHQLINLPEINSASNKQTLQATINSVNGGATELNTSNNSASAEVYVSDQALSFPFTETFESQSDAWTNDETSSLFMWYLDDEVGRNSKQSVSSFNTILVFYTTGYEESFKSPVLDLTTSDAPSIAFDVAFNYHKYTPPYFTADVVFADTLIVSISTDCGQSYTELYKKGGADLATVAEPILNPLSVNSCFFIPKADEWRTEAINLGAYKNESEAIIKFAYKSALGGNIYIDNIKMDKALSVQEAQIESPFKLYPNPANQHVNIQFTSQKQRSIKIYDALGHLKESFDSVSDYKLDISNYAQGMYTIEVTENGQRYVEKLIRVN